MATSLTDVRDALTYISPNQERDDWWKICAAIKNEFGDGGFDLFDQWSQGGDGYNAKDVHICGSSPSSSCDSP